MNIIDSVNTYDAISETARELRVTGRRKFMMLQLQTSLQVNLTRI